ncbi:MAG: hypothetical protein NC311_08940 [Muribaculaceae bacterium]|nr:hypothetical protein [Muribaculaceae bacterium]
MNTYVLQVKTGQEERLAERLNRRGVTALCPRERRVQHKGGGWRERVYVLFPGYLFVRCKDPVEVYYRVSGQSGVLRWLGMQGGSPAPLPPGEEARILYMAPGGGPLPASRAVKTPDGQLLFTEGPLAELADSIRKISRHDRRAEVRIPLYGETRTIRLSFTIEQETVQSAGAGSPPGRRAADRG